MRFVLLLLTGCVSAYIETVGGDAAKQVTRSYYTDMPMAWQAVIDVMKNSQLDVTNREGGFMLTKWIDNTSEKNFSDSFGNANVYLKAQYRLRISLAPGFLHKKNTVTIGIIKEQLTQEDLLEGFKPLPTDLIAENTLLYRIGRVITIRSKIAAADAEKNKKELQKSGL